MLGTRCPLYFFVTSQSLSFYHLVFLGVAILPCPCGFIIILRISFLSSCYVFSVSLAYILSCIWGVTTSALLFCPVVESNIFLSSSYVVLHLLQLPFSVIIIVCFCYSCLFTFCLCVLSFIISFLYNLSWDVSPSSVATTLRSFQSSFWLLVSLYVLYSLVCISLFIGLSFITGFSLSLSLL